MKKLTSKILILVGIFFILVAMLVSMFRFSHKNQPVEYGVSYSAEYAISFGLDWEETYKAILDQLSIKKLRLMSYWSSIELRQSIYDFKKLDKQFDLAASANAKISLAIGLRQPRWPECHEPNWAKNLSDQAWEEALTKYTLAVVERYKNHPALESWQLENEYYNKDFGKNCRNYDTARLQAEYDAVKNVDNTHPIIMNQSNQFGVPLRNPHSDSYGFSIYRRVYEARFLKRYVTHPIPAWFHSLRAQIVENLYSKPVIIHELQAEPWGNKPLTELSKTEQDQTMSQKQLIKNLNYAEATGIKVQYLWGAEWWYWRLQHGDSSIWETIRNHTEQNSKL